MRKLLLTFLLIFSALLVSEDVYGQYRRKSKARSRLDKLRANYKGGQGSGISFRFQKYHSVGINVNAVNYFGDITPLPKTFSTDISFTKPGLGLTHTVRVAPSLNIRTSYNWIRLKSDDFEVASPESKSSLPRYTRNLSFRNDVHELSTIVEVDIFSNPGGPASRLPVTPYLFGGLAVFYHNPKGLAPAADREGNPLPEAGTWVSLKPLGTEGQNSSHYNVKPYSNIQLAVPFGLGARFRLAGRFDAAFEIGYRILFFDYLDDVSNRYIDPGAFGDNQLARAMADRSLDLVSSKDRPRDTNRMFEAYGNTGTRLSSIDGKEYTILPGWGWDGDLRGHPTEDDQYVVTQIRLMYVLNNKLQGRAKFR